jgi:LmbE family N-acetylglucosaminyl deacetylase
MTERYLFLSPHYDDVVYSCGATMYLLAQSGAEVLNLTVMAGIPEPPFLDTPVLEDNLARWQAGENPMRTRRTEDQNAAAIIGADTLYMPLLDCLYRVDDAGQALYPTEESLWQTLHPSDPAITQVAASPVDVTPQSGAAVAAVWHLCLVV